jgi:mannose-6-phosphate isomerase-like protein (cupin superfamily)
VKKLDLASTFLVLDRAHTATPVEVTPTIWQELGERFEGFEGRVLLSCFSFDKDWDSWERHPAGDEVVCLLSGDVTMVLEGRADGVRLTQPGSCVVVPKNTWHTAKTSVETKMLFVTPGKGTEHRPL